MLPDGVEASMGHTPPGHADQAMLRSGRLCSLGCAATMRSSSSPCLASARGPSPGMAAREVPSRGRLVTSTSSATFRSTTYAGTAARRGRTFRRIPSQFRGGAVQDARRGPRKRAGCSGEVGTEVCTVRSASAATTLALTRRPRPHRELRRGCLRRGLLARERAGQQANWEEAESGHPMGGQGPSRKGGGNGYGLAGASLPMSR